MLNRLILVGRMTRDPENLLTPGGKQVAKSALAVERPYKVNGEKVTDFFDFEVWEKQADVLMEYTAKGSLIAIEGRHESRKYEEKTYWTVRVDNLRLLGSKKESEGVGF